MSSAPIPSTMVESTFWQEGLSVAGIDEVGRGSWAGPLCMGAVVLNPTGPHPVGVKDSKALTAAARTRVSGLIHAAALDVSLGWVSALEIDTIGLSAALSLAAVRAVLGLHSIPDVVIVDGPVNFFRSQPDMLEMRVVPIVKADATVLTVASASVVAKHARDLVMCDLATKFPCYHWEKNKGYMTRAHQMDVSVHGLCVEHRKSWRTPAIPA